MKHKTVKSTTNVYRLSDFGRATTIGTWRALGGRLAFSQWAALDLRMAGVTPANVSTIGELASASVFADREMARWAVERLNMPEFARVEYDNEI